MNRSAISDSFKANVDAGTLTSDGPAPAYRRPKRQDKLLRNDYHAVYDGSTPGG